MIRKDKLPNTWGDQWLPAEGVAVGLPIGDGQSETLLLTDEAWLAERLGGELRCMPLAERLDIEVGRDAALTLVVLQGINTPREHQSLISMTMGQGASVRMTTITLGGHHVRNNVELRMRGRHGSFEANGLYLVDRDQQCDNYIFVEHASPECCSKEMYKGIVDDAARVRFNGHVLVQDGAVKTEAYQTNRNILLTDKAHVDTRPFLEIYNDDVKCSHGSTIGQLDEMALFYLQARGISKRTAMTMLSYAFCDEVIRDISVAALRDVVGDMVKKRLHGELSPDCDECSIRCTTPCNGEEAHFEIDPSRL